MAILDQNGKPVYSSQFASKRPARSANLGGGDRPSESRNLRDIGKIVTKYDRQTLVSASKTLYLNSPIMVSALDHKAVLTVGSAWLPVYKGSDEKYGKAAKEFLAEWYEICNITGTSDFIDDLFIDSVEMDRGGDVFEYFTGTVPNGYPQIQIIPSHRIDAGGLPEGKLKDGRYSGSQFYHEDGIIYWRDTQKPVAYVFCDEDGKFSKFIEAQFIKHEFEKLWPEQKRGLPLFYHSLNGLRDILQAEEWERMNLLSMSSMTYTVHNETGGPDPEEPDYEPAEDCGEMAVQYLEGGRIMYAKAGSGEKIEQHQNFRPGNPWHEFYDMQARQALIGAGFPQSFWKPTGQGTAERNDIGKMCRMIEDRQTKIAKIAKWRVTRALAWGMANGRIPKSADWYNWGFTKPAKLTIDDGRSAKEKLELFRAGLVNADDIIGERGNDFAENLTARGEQIAQKYLNHAAMEAKYGIKMDLRDWGLLTPNEQPPQEPTTSQNATD